MKGNFITTVGPDAYGDNIGTADIMKVIAVTLGRKLFGVRNYKIIAGLSVKDLPKIVTYMEKRQIVTVIGHEFDLKDGVKAHEMSESHRVVGKIILKCN
jgi:NADPH:quinone reductase-like Zn-dependent oxidoreductase